jgi:hypothetical protein
MIDIITADRHPSLLPQIATPHFRPVPIRGKSGTHKSRRRESVNNVGHYILYQGQNDPR